MFAIILLAVITAVVYGYHRTTRPNVKVVWTADDYKPVTSHRQHVRR